MVSSGVVQIDSIWLLLRYMFGSVLVNSVVIGVQMKFNDIDSRVMVMVKQRMFSGSIRMKYSRVSQVWLLVNMLLICCSQLWLWLEQVGCCGMCLLSRVFISWFFSSDNLCIELKNSIVSGMLMIRISKFSDSDNLVIIYVKKKMLVVSDSSMQNRVL